MAISPRSAGANQPASGERRRSWLAKIPIEQILLALIYFYAARLALAFAFEKTNTSPFWPPAGVAMAALIISGPRAAIGTFAGAFFANLVTFVGNGMHDLPRVLLLSTLIGAGNASGALLGFVVAGRPRTDRGFRLDTRASLRLLVAALAAATLAALVGATTVTVGGVAPLALWPTILRIWVIGDGAGIFYALPLILAWWCDDRAPAGRRFASVPYVFLGLLGIAQVVLDAYGTWALWLMPIAPLIGIWQSSRRAVWTAGTLAAGLLIWQTARGIGPCADPDAAAMMLRLQIALGGSGALLLFLDGWLLKQDIAHSFERGIGLLFSVARKDLAAAMLPAFSVTALGMIITLLVWSSMAKQQEQILNNAALATAQTFGEHFVAEARGVAGSIERMARRWEDSGGITESGWRSDAINLARAFRYLTAVEWVDPLGVVRWVEPLAPNRKLEEFNLTRLPRRAGAFQHAIGTHAVMFTSIVDLVQGGSGFLAIAAIEPGEHPQGFIVGVIRLDRFVEYLAQRTEAATGNTFAIELMLGNKHLLALPPGPAAGAGEFSEPHDVGLIPGGLQVRARPRPEAAAAAASSLPSLVLNAGLLLSTLLGASVALLHIALAHARFSLAASRAKARFLAMMSHEIRTPLNGILGSTELVLTTSLNEDTREQIELISSSGRTLLAIINDILDFSKIEAGKLNLESIALDLRELAEQSIALFRAAAGQRGVEISCAIDPEIPRALFGDPVRLRQVVLNLLSNAVKFTNQGHVRLQVSVVGGQPQRPLVRILCEDTGIGMDAETRQALFAPFTQGDASTTRRFGGTGLGLAIVHQLVGQMEGEIRCTSVLGEGTTFVVDLPLLLASPAAIDTERLDAASLFGRARASLGASPLGNASLPSISAPPMGPSPAPARGAAPASAHVLLVEDNFVNQRVAGGLLARLGCTVDLAVNGREAVERCAASSYDLVLMDMQMPVMDGLEASRAIRAAESSQRRVPIVALSASVFSEDEVRCREAGMDAFVAKPVSMEELRRVVERFVVSRVNAQPELVG